MHTDKHRSEIDRVTEKIIGCAFTVGNRLGCGFLEKVYGNALVIELRRVALPLDQLRKAASRQQTLDTDDRYES